VHGEQRRDQTALMLDDAARIRPEVPELAAEERQDLLDGRLGVSEVRVRDTGVENATATMSFRRIGRHSDLCGRLRKEVGRHAYADASPNRLILRLSVSSYESLIRL